jgi:membrane protein DedA with SNARE-associated domain
MNELIDFVARHGYALLFFWVLAEQAALPIPSVPLLLVAGSLARTQQLHLPAVITYPVIACILADGTWFHLGRRLGSRVLNLICKISLEPDTCVRRTENMFVRHGLYSLLVSKFIPGLNVLAAPLAGASGTAFPRFLLFAGAGSLIWTSAYVSAGYAFADQLELVFGYAGRFGSSFILFIAGLLLAWIAWKSVQRYRVLKSVNVVRIGADELAKSIASGEDVTIVDVRTSMGRDGYGIPGALHIPIEDLPHRHIEIPRDHDIVLFCT